MFLWPRLYAGREASDVNLYYHWSRLLAHGLLPYRDFPVEYPPGVIPLMVLPRLHGLSAFRVEFVALSLLVDAGVLRLLRRGGARSGGCWVWVVAPLALGPIVWARLDMFVAALLVAAVIAFERDHVFRAGVWLAGAALLKAWPVLLLLVFAAIMPSGRRRLLGGAAVTAAGFVLPVLAWGGRPGLGSMLSVQTGRGLQLESVGASPLLLAHQFGAAERVVFRHGAYEIDGPGANLVAAGSTAIMAVAIVAVMVLLRRRSRDVGAAAAPVVLAVTAIVLVTSKVLSPQYLMWAVAAVTVSIDAARRKRAWLWSATLAALLITQLEYPILYTWLVAAGTAGAVIAAVHAVTVAGFAVVAVRTALEILPPSGPMPDRRPPVHAPGQAD